MTYQTGTILSATPSTDLMTVLENMLTAHPAWEFVENYVDGTYTNRVWKCLGTQNSWGQDFYVAFMRLTASIGTAEIQVKVAEAYNATTHVATRGNPSPASTLTPLASDASFGSGAFAFSHANWWTSTFTSFTTTTTAFQYYLVVTPDAIVMAGTSEANPLYIGLFTPYWADIQVGFEFPLCIVPLGYTDIDGAGSFTRVPGQQNISTADAFAAYWTAVTADLAQVLLGAIGSTNTLAGSKVHGSEMLVKAGSASVTVPRGVFSDLMYFSGSGNRGDTITFEGQTWVNVYPGVWANTEL